MGGEDPTGDDGTDSTTEETATTDAETAVTERDGETTAPADDGEESSTADGPLPATVHGRSLLGAVLMTALVALIVVQGQVAGPVGVAIALLFPLYFLVGVYRPWREQLPHYDQWLGAPLFAYGAYLLATEWPSVLGIVFLTLGAVALARIVHDWYVAVDVPEVE